MSILILISFLLGQVLLINAINIIYERGSKRHPIKVFNIRTEAKLQMMLLFCLLVCSPLQWFTCLLICREELLSIWEALYTTLVLEGSYSLPNCGRAVYFLVFILYVPLSRWPNAYKRITRQIPIVKFTQQDCFLVYLKEGLWPYGIHHDQLKDLKMVSEAEGSENKEKADLLTIPINTEKAPQPIAEILFENSLIRRNYIRDGLNIQFLSLALINYYLVGFKYWRNKTSTWSMYSDYIVLVYLCGYVLHWFEFVVNFIEARVDVKDAESLVSSNVEWGEGKRAVKLALVLGNYIGAEEKAAWEETRQGFSYVEDCDVDFEESE